MQLTFGKPYDSYPDIFGTVSCHILRGKYFVPSNFYLEIDMRLSSLRPHIACDSLCHPSELVGLDFWASLDDLDRSLCVLVLKDIATYPGSCFVDASEQFDDEVLFQVNPRPAFNDDEIRSELDSLSE